MEFPPNPQALQRHALDAFTVLSLLRPRWAGQLVLSLGLDEQGAGLLIASNIAGAVSLAIDDNPERIRDVVRSGAADFVVNTLDEALRAIKNEIRKQMPLSVALQAAPDTALAEAVERGLAPALFTRFANIGTHEDVLHAAIYFDSLGASIVDFDHTGRTRSATDLSLSAATLVTPLLSGENWSCASYFASSPTDLRAFDQAALDELPAAYTLRRRWLDGAQRILARQRPPHRLLWLSPAEFDSIAQRGFSLSRA